MSTGAKIADMTQLAESQGAYRAAFEQVQQETLDSGSGLAALRERAFTRFTEWGFPTTKLERWRFTNVGPIAKGRFALATARAGEVDLAALARYDLPGVTSRVVCVDGRFAPQLSNLGDLPAGVEIRSLADVLAADPTSLEPHLGQLAGFEGAASSFTALNTALLHDGLVVRVAPGTVVDTPLHMMFAATGSGAAMAHPRVLAVAGANSQIRLVESYVGLSDAPYLTNGVTEVFVEDGAVVDHYKLLRESLESYHVASMHLRLGRSANFSSHAITLGGAIVRNDVFATLDGEGGECTLNGLYLADGRRLVDNHTTITHAKAHCDSHELYKGILSDQAHAVFNGKIIVEIDAQKTDAKQTNKALLLSEDAQINTKPELEISADDVRCTHGATIGQLDAESLFYLRSRGLSSEQARRMLIHAFASDLLNRIRIDSIRKQLDDVLLQQLPAAASTTFAMA